MFHQAYQHPQLQSQSLLQSVTISDPTPPLLLTKMDIDAIELNKNDILTSSTNIKNEKIHSGHFMVSEIPDSKEEDDEIVDDEVEVSSNKSRSNQQILLNNSLIKSNLNSNRNNESSNDDANSNMNIINCNEQLLTHGKQQKIINSSTEGTIIGSINNQNNHQRQFQHGYLIQNEFCTTTKSMEKAIRIDKRKSIKTYRLKSLNCRISFDQTLWKLFECMTLAYSDGKLTSPKWKTFKGLNMNIKDKIRLNNIIWRAWHIQYISGRKPVVCQFSSNIETERHKKTETILLEGKYWKRRIDVIKAEYNKWRLYYQHHFKLKGKDCSQTSNASTKNNQYDWENNLPRWSNNLSFDSIFSCSSTSSSSYMLTSNTIPNGNFITGNELSTNFSTTVTTSSSTHFYDVNVAMSTITSSPSSSSSSMPYTNYYEYATSRDIARSGMGAEFMQPGLEQLQPNIDFMDTFEPTQEFMSSFNRINNNQQQSQQATNLLPSVSVSTEPIENGNHFNSIRDTELFDDPILFPLTNTNSDQSNSQTLSNYNNNNNSNNRNNSAQFQSVLNNQIASNQCVQTNSGYNTTNDVPNNSVIYYQHQMHNQHNLKPQENRLASTTGSTTSTKVLRNTPVQSANHAFVTPANILEQTQESNLMIQNQTFPIEANKIETTQTSRNSSHLGLHHNNQSTASGANYLFNLSNSSDQKRRHLKQQPQAQAHAHTHAHAQQQQQQKEPHLSAPLNFTANPNSTSRNSKMAPSTNFVTDHLMLTQGSSANKGSIHPHHIHQPYSHRYHHLHQTHHHHHQITKLVNPIYNNANGNINSTLIDRSTYRERRRVCHINAEQKRRCNIKNGFDTLRSLLPSLNREIGLTTENISPSGTPNLDGVGNANISDNLNSSSTSSSVNCSANTKISKAAMLHKAADYIRILKNEKFEQQKEFERLKQQVEMLNHEINIFQNQLPTSGQSNIGQWSIRIKEQYQKYVTQKTIQNWKFWIFSIIMESLLESYCNTVSTTNFEEMCKTIFRWLDQSCSIVTLRKDVLNSLRFVSTSTNILTNPETLRDEILIQASGNQNFLNKFQNDKCPEL